jgi:hypothetical protein
VSTGRRRKAEHKTKDPLPFDGLRVGLDGEWLASEMAIFLTCLSDLYEFRMLFMEPELFRSHTPVGHHQFVMGTLRDESFQLPPSVDFITHLADLKERDRATGAPTTPPLRVRSILYASPGFSDLGGVGKVCEAVADLLKRIIDAFAERKQRAAEASLTLAKAKEIEHRIKREDAQSKQAVETQRLTNVALAHDIEMRSHDLSLKFVEFGHEANMPVVQRLARDTKKRVDALGSLVTQGKITSVETGRSEGA